MSKSILVLGAATVFIVIFFSFWNIQSSSEKIERLKSEIARQANKDALGEVRSGNFDVLAEAYGFAEAGRRVPGIGYEKYKMCLESVSSLRIFKASGDVVLENTEMNRMRELTSSPKSTYVYASAFNVKKFKWLNQAGMVNCT